MKLFFLILIFAIPIYPFDKTYSLDYIYVNANTGQSSGGHTGLRFENQVFHFQFYPDKIFHIIREPWENFRYIYGIQENRTIQIKRIKLSKENYHFFLERMNQVYLIQNKELDNLVKLENDVKILNSILFGDNTIHLKAAGYFLKDNYEQNSYQDLHKKINSNLGKNFLLKNLTLIRRKIYNFKIPLKELAYYDLKKNKYPSGVENYSSDYLELQSLLKVFEVLYEGSEISANSFFELKSEMITTLNNIQLNKLIQFSINLEEEILFLLKSESDNKGYPLLVLVARYLVVKKSIIDKKLYFLDTFAKNHSLIVGEIIQDKSFLSATYKRISKKIFNTYNKLFEKSVLSEIDYTLLEDAANRQREILNGLKKSEPIRINFEQMLPSKEDNVQIHFDQISKDSLYLVLDRAYAIKTKYALFLQKKYSFNLFTKNCTTEIFHSLNSFFENGDIDSKNKLGGIIHEDDFLVFIPEYAYSVVGKEYRVFEEINISSLRNKILKRKDKGSIFSLLRESSTLTSEYYKFNKEDSFFIFFTDDVYWRRPIYGIVNIFAGIGEMGVGIFFLPFDKGGHLLKGIQGIIFSSPEIFFFNIRKGTFLYEGEIDWVKEEENANN